MACVLAGGCNDGNVTGKSEGVGFVHNVGAQHDYVPFLSVCVLKTTILPQINEGSGYIDMNGTTTKIKTSPLTRKPYASRPCVKNTNFTLTPNTGSGGTTWSCRYKITAKGSSTQYTYFTVQVDAGVTTETQTIQAKAAILQEDIEGTTTSKARVQHTRDETAQAKARVIKTELKTIQAKAAIKQSDVPQEITAKSRIKQEDLDASIQAKSSIKQFGVIRTTTAKARIEREDELESIEVKARIQHTEEKSVDAKSRIRVIDISKTIQGKSRIKKYGIINTSDAKARIKTFENQAISAKSRLKKLDISNSLSAKAHLWAPREGFVQMRSYEQDSPKTLSQEDFGEMS